MADGPKPDESDQNPNDLTENTKLWLGKDYSNFIRKDWVQLDKPFEGTSLPSATGTGAHGAQAKLKKRLNLLEIHHLKYTVAFFNHLFFELIVAMIGRFNQQWT